jgi:hypothetical protein
LLQLLGILLLSFYLSVAPDHRTLSYKTDVITWEIALRIKKQRTTLLQQRCRWRHFLAGKRTSLAQSRCIRCLKQDTAMSAPTRVTRGWCKDHVHWPTTNPRPDTPFLACPKLLHHL